MHKKGFTLCIQIQYQANDIEKVCTDIKKEQASGANERHGESTCYNGRTIEIL